MIYDTRPKLATVAGQTRRTCRRRHVSVHDGGLLLRIILICCFITVTCGSKLRQGMNRKDFMGSKSSKYSSQHSQIGYCDLDIECDWSWDESHGFKKVKASRTNLSRLFPITDANNASNGHFLWFSGKGQRQDAQISSKSIPRTGPHCRIEFSLYMVEMENGFLNLVIQTNNMSSIAVTKSGNNSATWKKMSFSLRAIDQPYKLFIEVYVPHSNASIGIDNLRLVNCFPEFIGDCTENMFRCNNGSCLNKTRVCDFTKDCADGEDEALECDKIPKNARCNFEDSWCGWTNVPERPLNWTLHKGPTPTERTGPSYDHTYRNKTGTYAFVNMAKSVPYGSRASIVSPLYNPTPPYSSDPKSPYYRSCQIRFFYNKYGPHSASLGLFLVQIKPYANLSDNLWWSYGGDKSDVWINEAIALPDIKYRYYLEFEAAKGFSPKSDIAIDDISLSPECFGIGVPRNVVGDFNYYNPMIESEKVPLQHSDFINETVIRITTCGVIGRKGPTRENCTGIYNNTDVKLFDPIKNQDVEERSALDLEGVQRWTAPRGEYYTIIAVGARGGQGSSNTGLSLGALVRGVIELQKGDQLYFMMGQEGTDACAKNLGLKTTTCPSSDQITDLSQQTTSKVRQVKRIEFKNPGGGGGGATAILTLKANGDPEPILIAGGGGGLGLNPSSDNGLQHGRGPFPAGRHLSTPSLVSERMGGPGASWNGTWPNFQKKAWGMPLIHGGVGGQGCESGNDGHGNGGFGGGGGGCQSGGGGGGYVGGNAGRNQGSGEGGYSYASQKKLTDVYFKAAAHSGPGEIFIIPAISGCNCDYRCVALDQYMSETKCLCPQGWLLSNDSKSCIMADDTKGGQHTYMIQLVVVIGLFTIIGICLISYKRYKKQKALSHRRQAMFGNGTELAALRPGHISDTMMTEFNPNYEFAGNLYSFKDLPQIPRDCITLVKPLGQGAFGIVYQGVYKYRRNEEQPVAVKTTSVSTTHVEADFMTEALIMSKFDHPNIVHFIGVCFDKHPRYIVLELLAGGDLKNFLREERPRSDRSTSLTMLDLIMFSYDVANGCKYMEEARFIHRDIAARNCLLTTKAPGRTVKIADFGMARDIYRSDYYKKDGRAMLPIKWMPPESFMDGIFTTKTDVWSFGVLLWEIMSFGYMPYTGCGNPEVISLVRSGGRLAQPTGCPDPIYGIMMRCWSSQPEKRPSFATISERIGYCLQDPDVINQPPPNFDILAICNEMEGRCINVQSDLDGGYMQPKLIDPQSVARRVDQAMGSTYDSENEKSIEDCKLYGGSYTRSTGCHQGTLSCNTYASSVDAFEQNYNSDNDHDEDRDDEVTAGDCKGKLYRIDRQDNRAIHRTSDIEKRDNIDNGNNRPEDECHMTANIDSAITDRKNGNESTTTTDTNSDSLIAQSSDTPPDTITNSSPNTRTCSPSRIIGLNANVSNVNGMVKKNTLKATLSLDPSALSRGTIPYEITTRTRSSTPGSMELRKDSLGHELPREEECSC
ncbi:PREDICTED: ALK tyrosine kinase receptor isoform X2 [Wasmannia auropunctata]|nr:PREDICTED: ALK tyrosine kinase receptor isoform X2 [Wasmannia auropunctata]XP_011703179.1 PREDICTED: ALK tyrosine kinase receptor isoform X2 [Wasmannia auropunctata]XP_011703180.1 PREDICTED: ALK tyrosine kinase receptor isoform X2 [Wasmannia auropunctata]